MERALPSEWSEWDASANTVTFHIPRSYLADAKVTAPYDVFALTSYPRPTRSGRSWPTTARPTPAPSASRRRPVTSRPARRPAAASPSGSGSTAAAPLDPIVLERPGGNTFTAADTSLGVTGGPGHEFTPVGARASDVELLLGWQRRQ